MKFLGFEIRRIKRIAKAQAAMNLAEQAHSRITTLEAQNEKLIQNVESLTRIIESIKYGSQ